MAYTIYNGFKKDGEKQIMQKRIVNGIKLGQNFTKYLQCRIMYIMYNLY